MPSSFPPRTFDKSFNGKLPSGRIVQGWVKVSYNSKALCLLGKGDRVTRSLGPSILLKVHGPLSLEEREEQIDSTSSIITALARQAARLCAPAPARTADFFLEVYQKIDPKGTGPMVIPLGITQTALSPMLGMTPIHLNRVLRGLDNAGVLSYWGGVCQILDRNKLAEVAEPGSPMPLGL